MKSSTSEAVGGGMHGIHISWLGSPAVANTQRLFITRLFADEEQQQQALGPGYDKTATEYMNHSVTPAQLTGLRCSASTAK